MSAPTSTPFERALLYDPFVSAGVKLARQIITQHWVAHYAEPKAIVLPSWELVRQLRDLEVENLYGLPYFHEREVARL